MPTIFRRTAFAVLLALPLSAQTGVIQGTLLDPTGSAVPNAKVTAYDEEKNLVVRESASGEDGGFQLRPLLPGNYTVKAEAPGFKSIERKGLKLDLNQTMNLGALNLEVGDATESVTVEATAPLVETTTAVKSFTITNQQVRELSLNSRDFTALMRTLPGVTSTAASDFRLTFNETTNFNVNGLRGSMNNVYLDGTVNTDVGDNGGQYTQLSLDAVGEFRVLSNPFAAEYGRNAGVVISANTKAGTSAFHGGLYEFLRNDALDARFPFDTTGKPPKVRFNQFGGNIGGPVPGLPGGFKNRLFFFFNYEGTRATRPNGGNFVDVPHPDLLRGDFRRLFRDQQIATAPQFRVGTVFRPGTITRDNAGNITGGVPYPDNTIPQSEWSRNASAFLKVLNAVDRAPGVAVANSPELLRVPIQDTYTYRKDQKALRVDYNASAKMNIFFRWVDDNPLRERTGLGIFTSTPYPIYPMYRVKPGSSWSWNVVNVISPSITNEFIFGYTHQSQVVDVDPGADTSTYDRNALGFQYGQLFPDANVRNRFPRFNCAVGSCNFGGFSSNWRNDGKDYAWTDNLSIVRTSHTLKFGIFYNLDDKQQQPSWNDAGNFDFSPSRDNLRDANNGLANLLLGNYTSHQQGNGVFYGKFRYTGVEFYGQDAWKVNRRLTLEFGARYVYLGPTYTRGDLLANYFDPARYDPARAVRIETARGLTQGSIIPGSGDPFNGIVQENSAGIPSGFGKHRKNQVSPRFGFAFDPFGDGATSVRGGFGIFYERVRQNVNSFDALGNPPLAYTPSLFSGNIDDLNASLISAGVRFPVNLTAMDAEYQTPTVYSWSFTVQRQLGKQMSIDVGYVGNAGRHLQYRKDINQLPLGSTTGTPILTNANNTTNAIRPYLGYGSINFTEYGAISNYHGLQTRLSRRFSERLTLNLNYTWSKAMNEVDTDDATIAYYLDRSRQYGPAGFDRTHVFNADYVYQLPDFGSKLGGGVLNPFLNGWQVSGITRFWSGLPLTITSGGNPGTLGGGVWADYLGGELYPAEKSRNEYFNPLVFGRPRDGSLGNTGKGILRGPGVNNWDFSVFKNTQITERVRTQFRFEVFNIFNHTQWNAVNTGIGVPNPGTPVTASTRGTTGQVTSTRDPRNIQLGLKLYF